MADRRAPIGVFDSGLGGLTILKALREAFPAEDFVFVGDLAHLPYGDKSARSIRHYADRIVQWLAETHHVKALVIACNSASASAAYFLRRRWGRHFPIVDVISPMVDYVGRHPAWRTVGVIGTRRTIASRAYARRFREKYPHVTVRSKATPLLAPMIEEGFFNNTISRSILRNYLPPEWTQGLDALVLGCTHYPLIHSEIEAVLERPLAVIDSTEVVPSVVGRWLGLSMDRERPPTGKVRIFVTEWSEAFRKSLHVFMGTAYHPVPIGLWN